MKLRTEPFETQCKQWPQAGQHILAHYDDASIVVYQAYRPSIGRFAIEHQYFGGADFSFSRMSWIKPNFLWMMYRSGWGTKEGQEITLGLRIRRDFFDRILEQAVPSSYDPAFASSRDAWKAAVEASNVRLQWDPDHSPSGAKLERRAIQLGLRGPALKAFAQAELLEVIDLTDFVASQRANLDGAKLALLQTPVERVYLPRSVRARERIGLDGADEGSSS
jgi:hypothetical protein